MYRDYFGFKEPPFTLTPNPEFLFLSRCHQEAYAHLLYAIENRAGFIELSGEVGTGKTTIIRTLLGHLSTERYRSALIFNPMLSPLGLLQEINREFGLPFAGGEARNLHQILNEFLLRENAADRTVILVIDEAQNLSRDVLEQVRLISNLETEKEKLIQIVLVGQPELRRLLDREDLRQLRQRITVRYHLERMAYGEIDGYIRHRIRIAAAGKEPVSFSPAAVKRLARYAKGLPRLINSACDRALLLAYTRETREITAPMMRLALNDLERPPGKLSSGTAFACLLLAALIAAAAVWRYRGENSAPPVAAAGESSRLSADGVVKLQEMLAREGHYRGTISGRFDSATETAVRTFQRAEGLQVDGKPGGQTLLHLYRRTGGRFAVESSAGRKEEAHR